MIIAKRKFLCSNIHNTAIYKTFVRLDMDKLHGENRHTAHKIAMANIHLMIYIICVGRCLK